MKVGVFTYGIHGVRMTGIARYAVELTRAMARLDPSLEIVLLNPYPESQHPWYREFPTHPLPHLNLLPLAATVGNLELHRTATRLKLDILHDPCGIAPFLAPRGRYRKVTTIHDTLPAVYPKTQPLLTRIVFSTLVARAGATSDAILTVSRTSADDLCRYYGFAPAKVHVTPNGVHRAVRLSPALLRATFERLGVQQPYFLYVGALHPRKNIRRVLEAFRKLREFHREASLVIAGPPSWGAHGELKAVLGSAGGQSGIVFTDFLSDDDLNSLYQGAHALVFPSLYEGFGLPVLEAMSHGAPVITSNVSALPEVAGAAALLVDPTSVEAIFTAMARLIEDLPLHAELRRKGFERSTEFTWEKTAAGTLEIYETLVGKGSGS